MKNLIFLPCFALFSLNINAQLQLDSGNIHHIQEVIVIGTAKLSAKENKPLGSIDEYLQKSAKVDMIKRGAYAWEPLINGLPTERTLVTIDGMRIFGACTDKMDPITSYVEVSNLQEAEISSGQGGACHGNTIGGAIDLKRNKSVFGREQWNFNVNTGFETVNSQKIFGAGAKYKTAKFYSDVNFMLRDAENYKAGNNQEIPYSQFKKMNISAISGAKIAENKLLEASIIYDKATDVGYPALPMDVSLAEALITSLKFQVVPQSDFLKSWETKIYFNTVTHRMDDTKRPDTQIHMDMPGWSDTFGYYSQLKSTIKNHNFLLNIAGFYNKSTAEMTMYPNDKTEKLMYMLTWPEVGTLAQTVFLEDKIQINEHSDVKFSASATLHQNKVESDFGLSSLQIFYPEMNVEKTRILKSFAANYNFEKNGFEAGFGLGYGDRAPSVSEGYGFYLFNSFEKFDYIGNPDLKNEASFEGNAFLGLKQENYKLKLASSYFKISDYIVGNIVQGLVPMTIGARGVKKYSALESADVFNISLNADFQLLELLKWNSQIVYLRGKDSDGQNLPFMSPLSYQSSLRFAQNKFSTEASVSGNSKHRNFAANYGESETPAYFIVNLNAGYNFSFGKTKLFAKAGVENLLNRYYTSYADWNHLPRPGRNFYLNLNFSL